MQRGADLLLVSGGGGWFGRGPAAAAAVDSEGEWQQGPIQGPGKRGKRQMLGGRREIGAAAQLLRERCEKERREELRERAAALLLRRRGRRGVEGSKIWASLWARPVSSFPFFPFSFSSFFYPSCCFWTVIRRRLASPRRRRLGVRKVGERRNSPYRLKNYG